MDEHETPWDREQRRSQRAKLSRELAAMDQAECFQRDARKQIARDEAAINAALADSVAKAKGIAAALDRISARLAALSERL